MSDRRLIDTNRLQIAWSSQLQLVAWTDALRLQLDNAGAVKDCGTLFNAPSATASARPPCAPISDSVCWQFKLCRLQQTVHGHPMLALQQYGAVAPLHVLQLPTPTAGEHITKLADARCKRELHQLRQMQVQIAACA